MAGVEAEGVEVVGEGWENVVVGLVKAVGPHPDPDRLDLTRHSNPHTSFGHGLHFCLGANLARWELRSALRALLPVLPEMELAGPEVRVPNLHVPAIQHLPVRSTQSAGSSAVA